MAAQKATEIRRRLSAVLTEQAALRQHQAELEAVLFAAPATTWPEAAAKARYLVELFAETSEGRDSHRQKLIASVLEDLAKLSDCPPRAGITVNRGVTSHRVESSSGVGFRKARADTI